jgi:hypothetical protein
MTSSRSTDQWRSVVAIDSSSRFRQSDRFDFTLSDSNP